MRLKLEQVPKRTLEIEKPDGSIIALTIRRFALKDVPALEDASRELEKKRISGKITTCEYYNSVIDLLVEDFAKGSFDDLEVEHLMAISQGLQEMKKSKEQAEKKSPAR